jgi:hypothetical protein
MLLLVRFALAGTAVAFMLAAIGVARVDGGPVGFVHPGVAGPSAVVFRRDLPDQRLVPGLGHDGQQFYAIARQPMHIRRVAPALDRPRYRLQRPLLPWLAWGLHPGGGGIGLVYAIVAVGLVGIVIGGVSLGALSVTLGGRAWPALAYPLLPGSYMSLRLGVADALAVSLALLAITLVLRSRWRAGVVTAVLAVLAKEVVILLLLGFALWRGRKALVLVAVPAGVTFAWWAVLRAVFPHDPGGVNEIVLPFTGFADAVGRWRHGEEVGSALIVATTLAIAGWQLATKARAHPLAGAVVLQLALTCCVGSDVIGPMANGTRTTLALAALVAVWFAAPTSGAPQRVE